MRIAPVFLVVAALSAHARAADGVRTADEVPFIGGALWSPEPPWIKNARIVQDTTVPGQTHVEVYVCWRFLENRKDAWDFSSLIDAARVARRRGLKVLVFPWTQYAPAWFKETEGYVPLQELATGKTADVLSPWAPGTLEAVEHFYAALAAHAGAYIDIVSVGAPTSDYGEVGLLIGASQFLPGGRLHQHFPQDPDAWHYGYWCGDRWARRSFRKWAAKRYGSVEALNKAWGTSYDTPRDITFPERETRHDHRRRWMDFIYWYLDSQTDLAEKVARIVRRHFPDIMLEAKLGYGNDSHIFACDKTGVCHRMSAFRPFTIRSTHAATNRGAFPEAYYNYKRMAPVCRKLGLGFGTESPGGDLTLDELGRRIFEDASAGVNYVFCWHQNFNLADNVVDRFKAVLRPQERSLVEIAVVDPTAQRHLDAHFAERGQIEFCAQAREFFDYDIVDENMLGWGMLDDYKVLIGTRGTVFEQTSLEAIDRWLRAGGMLVVPENNRWETVEGDTSVMAEWLAGNAQRMTGVEATACRIARGALVLLDSASTEGLVRSCAGVFRQADAILPELGSIHGFEGEEDGLLTTFFPSGRLVYDTRTGETRFFTDRR